MASILYYLEENQKAAYFDRKQGLTEEEYFERLKTSSTLYVGNLSFYTQEYQLLQYFSLCSKSLPRMIMGLNKQTKTPCGFCFVEFGTREEAATARDLLNLKLVDGRAIRVDWDIGFQWGRQFGRGRNGGQVRDEVNTEQIDKDRPKPNFRRRNNHNNEHNRNNNDSNDNKDGQATTADENSSNINENQGDRKDYRERNRGGRGDGQNYRGNRGSYRGGRGNGRGQIQN
ncbi:rna-binding region rnp-1 domain-containing protein [Stylonychia lemnae]|uniref:Nuclear cap-binding protein subunit 2 n=1 Tax=Stylonychia lemnae TaxID=5949 RepID=A0A078AR16_STYLE|nr:rna-binding region rnp-1 domain-containing protein [Stylonychia lemnae]|eukprot:CDW84860.1 rna-binding region rnp-1 domain-containing protein [Stylonychia lemnae]